MTTCVALLETIRSARIKNIQFGLLNPEIVRRQSVVHVTKTTLYQRQLPIAGGLNDLRMGTSDRRLPCGTCKNDVLSCVGHPGHIELAAPVYHVSMINVVVKVLRCVCFFCSRLLLDVDEDVRVQDERFKTSDPKDRLNLMVNMCNTRHFCRHCNGPQPKYTQTRGIVQIRTEFRPKDLTAVENEAEYEFMVRPFTAAQARSILEFIPDDEVELLGISPKYARPEWLILTVLQVPPPISRPSIMATDGSRARGQDDITIKLQEIVKANLAVQTALSRDAPNLLLQNDVLTPVPVAVTTAIDILQQHLAQFMHYDTSGNATQGATTHGGAPRSNRPLRLVPARIKGKKGRFRGTLGGKRVDYSARTVVSPAPGYDIDEVGVPQLIAQHLTFPERVTALNLKELSERVVNGPDKLHGATAVILPNGTLIDLTLSDERNTLQLQPGWVVERYLKNGDWVLFNRQPSLHRMSIMAHRVRIIPDKTFRLPICDTTPYNADFDGDEMNMHVLRSLEAVAEAREMMSVTSQIISPQSNKPIIGLVQDSLVAVYLMTSKDTFLNRSQVMQLMMPVDYPLVDVTMLPMPSILKPEPLWTGKQVFSFLFPRISLDMVVRNGVADGIDKKPDGVMDMLERRVVVHDGCLLAGSLCKKTMGVSAGGIIHVIVKDCGNEVAKRFISDSQRILVEFMMIRGFSVGIGDCMMGSSTHEKVNSSINRYLRYADKILEDACDAPAKLVEACVTKLMTGVLTKGGGVVQEDLPLDNNVYTMVQSGAKGSSVNIAQILACVGQQSVEGGRIAPDSRHRTLPCYPPNAACAESRGFVANSYGTGLTAQEYFYHAMGGREGLVDTAVKTASTGYIQRRLVKAKEGLQVRYDHTVRNTKDQVVQFLYGGDSFDPVFVEKQSMRTLFMSNAQLAQTYTISRDDAEMLVNGAVDWTQWQPVLEIELKTLLKDRDAVRAAKFRASVPLDSTVFVTVAPARLMETARRTFGIKRTARIAPVNPKKVWNLVCAAYKEISSLRSRSATFMTLAYVRSIMSMRALLVDHRLSIQAIEWVTRELVRTYRNSLTAPGEMVGTLGAASIGEPCTQMTLNTFHTAGVGEKTVTLGVPRLKELIDTSRNIKTPSLSVFFEQPYASSETMARTLGVAMEYTLLHHVVLNSCVEHDPDPWHTTVAEDAAMVSGYRMLYKRDPVEDATLCEWVIRFVLDRKALAAKSLTVMHVSAAIQQYMGDSVQIMRSEVNMVTWCIRVRIKHLAHLFKDIEGVMDKEERSQLERAAIKTTHDFLLDNVPVHGVPGVSRSIVHQAHKHVVDAADGSLARASEWMSDTEGTNLRTVLTLPGVNKQRTISNDIHEVLDVLGIEAAQQVLLDEIRAVLSFDSAYVNERHLQLLTDVMTLSGTLTAMTRHSMHKLGGSTYHHASFEETQDVLIHAAAFGTRDHVSGVTENLMIGQLMPGGTGSCDIISLTPPPKQTSTAPSQIVKPLELHTTGRSVAAMPTTKQQVVKPLSLPTPAAPRAMKVAPLVVKPLEKPVDAKKESEQFPTKRKQVAHAPSDTSQPAAKVMVKRTVMERPTKPKVVPVFSPLSPRSFTAQKHFRPLSPTPIDPIDSFFE